MILEECLRGAGLRDLRTFTEAWKVDVVKRDDVDEYVDKALAHRPALSDSERVEHHLSLLTDLPYRAQMLVKAALRQLLNTPAYIAAVDEFNTMIIEQERQFVEWASKPNALKHLDPKVVDIYRTVLEAAWEDAVNEYEFRLLERLRAKLGITRRDHRVIELQLGKFPSIVGGPHTAADIEEATKHLARRGLLIKTTVGGRKSYAIPEELAQAIRDQMGIELTAPTYGSLLQHLPVSTLRSGLEKAGQPFTGNREFLAARLIDGYVSPKLVLRGMSDDELTALLIQFPLVRQDGAREIRVRNIVKYFDKLELAVRADPAQRADSYVAYYAELAARNYPKLRAAGVIAKDKHVDRAFETATTSLFVDYLGMNVEEMDGTRHADGKALLPGDQRVLLWDCKSCETAYTLTDQGARQFLGYCSEAAPRVACPMLIIAPEFSADSADAAQRLKALCPPGTEIALITAGTLLWLARTWRQKRAKSDPGPLPWQVLATSGILDETVVKKRLKTFAT